MNFHVLSIFPSFIDNYLEFGVLARAKKENKINVYTYDLRVFTKDKHKKVDDTSYGGGPGMVMQIQPIFDCLEGIKKNIKNQGRDLKKTKIVLLAAKGDLYNQKKANDYSTLDDLILICGRYEGVDERVAKYLVDDEISIGKFVLTGGELAALTILDSVSRLLPDVLGNKKSLDFESYSNFSDDLDFPVYTKPVNFNNWEVPKVLLSGNHAEIEKWRKSKNNQ